jgi:hypothetical protein
MEKNLEGLGPVQMQNVYLVAYPAIRNRCWTAYRLAKKGLSHPIRCPLCDQEEEAIQHLLTSCDVARQVWFNLLVPLNLAALVPQTAGHQF